MVTCAVCQQQACYGSNLNFLELLDKKTARVSHVCSRKCFMKFNDLERTWVDASRVQKMLGDLFLFNE